MTNPGNGQEGLILPTAIDPVGLRCVTLFVPDDPAYIYAVDGAILRISQWQAWERDPMRRGTQAAQRMLQMYLSMAWDTCAVADIYRIDPENSCIIQVSHDGGTTWVTFIDIRACEPDISHFLVDNPGAVRDNNVNPVSGHFGILINQNNQTAIGASGSSAVYPMADLYNSGDGTGYPPLRLGRANTTGKGFLWFFYSGANREGINRRTMFLAPPLSAISPDSGDIGGIYIKASDGRGYIILPDGIGGAIEQLIGDGSGTLTTLTDSYTLLSAGSTPRLFITGSGDTRNIDLGLPPIVSTIPEQVDTFTPTYTALPAGSNPQIVITRTGVNAYQVDDQSPPIPYAVQPPDTVLPGTGLKAFTFLIDARGTILPFLVPAGYGINAIDIVGFWGWVIDPGTGNIKISNGNPTGTVNETDLKLWQLSAPIDPVLGQSRLGYTGAITDFVATVDQYLMLSMLGVVGSVSPFDPNVFGQLYITLTLSAPIAGWTITLHYNTTGVSPEYGTQGGVVGSGDGGAGIYAVRYNASLICASDTTFTKIIINASVVDPHVTNVETLAYSGWGLGSDFNNTSNAAGTISHEFDISVSPGAGTFSGYGIESLNSADYPANAYATHLTSVVLKGTGTPPTIV